MRGGAFSGPLVPLSFGSSVLRGHGTRGYGIPVPPHLYSDIQKLPYAFRPVGLGLGFLPLGFHQSAEELRLGRFDSVGLGRRRGLRAADIQVWVGGAGASDVHRYSYRKEPRFPQFCSSNASTRTMPERSLVASTSRQPAS